MSHSLRCKAEGNTQLLYSARAGQLVYLGCITTVLACEGKGTQGKGTQSLTGRFRRTSSLISRGSVLSEVGGLRPSSLHSPWITGSSSSSWTLRAAALPRSAACCPACAARLPAASAAKVMLRTPMLGVAAHTMTWLPIAMYRTRHAASLPDEELLLRCADRV